jgi:transposase-like protein
VQSLIDDSGVAIELRQSKYLNKLVEQDHRTVKRRTRLCSGSRTFIRPPIPSPALMIMHMIRKGQLNCSEGKATSAASQFYSLAF